MLLIKNDPKYQELWPRALVPYKRIYGIDEPPRLVHRNDGKKSPHLPAGTPFGLVGTSSLYKRESYPNGVVPAGSVTAVSAKPNDRKQQWRELAVSRFGFPGNWGEQGADAGLYENSDIWGIRILVLEPVSDVVSQQAAPLRAGQQRRGAHPHPGRVPGAQVLDRTASSRSIRTAIPTPASWPRSRPTSPGPSRRSTTTAWC